MSDLFLTLSTGSPLLINEVEFFDSILSTNSHKSKFNFPLAKGDIVALQTQQSNRNDDHQLGESDKWMPFFSGFPKETIFGASDINSKAWAEQAFGFFQVGHLFSNLNDMLHVVKLSFITRRCIRYSKSPAAPLNTGSPELSYLYNLVPQGPFDIVRIHDFLIMWFEELPTEFKLWTSLDCLISENSQDIDRFTILPEGVRLTATGVLANLLFFTSLSVLHQTNADCSALKFDEQGNYINEATLSKPHNSFRVASSLLSQKSVSSCDILKLAYRGLIYLLRRVYASTVPPSITSVPPSEIVGHPIIPTLLVPPAIALLSQRDYTAKLLESKRTGDIPTAHGVESLEAFLLPVLDNIGQIWGSAYTAASGLRDQMEKIRDKLQGDTRRTSMFQTFNPSAASALHFQVTPANASSTMEGVQSKFADALKQGSQDSEVKEKSWQDLRNEFEDEFLL
jgi:hypothetical protein